MFVEHDTIATPHGEFRPRILTGGSRTTELEQAAESAWLVLSTEAEWNRPEAVALVFELHRKLTGDLGAPVPTQWSQGFDQRLKGALADLEAAVWAGRLVFEKITLRLPHLKQLDAPPPVVSPSPPVVAGGEALTSFEVTVLDEVGEALDGVELELSCGTKRETQTTDGSGKAKWTGMSSSFGTLSFKRESAVREALYDRWSQARGKDWFEAEVGKEEQYTFIPVRRREALKKVTLVSDEPHTLVLTPRVIHARLFGLCFGTSKCFLLPTARESLSRIKQLYDQNRETDLLVVGHTDRAGQPSYNDPLSLERANAMVAYLKDDVDAWYAWYGSSKPDEKRWGDEEDQAMIEGVAEDQGETIPADKSPVEWYQETRGLKVDDIAGEETRTTLIKEYMALDGTTLPADIKISAHGCGENFAVTESPDGVAAQEDRRVEIFFFENPYHQTTSRPDAVLPAPPGDNSGPGAQEYPEWVRRAQELHDLSVGSWLRLMLRYEDGTVGSNVSVKLRLSDGSEPTALTNDRGILVLHAPVLESWDIVEIQDASELVSFV